MLCVSVTCLRLLHVDSVLLSAQHASCALRPTNVIWTVSLSSINDFHKQRKDWKSVLCAMFPFAYVDWTSFLATSGLTFKIVTLFSWFYYNYRWTLLQELVLELCKCRCSLVRTFPDTMKWCIQQGCCGLLQSLTQCWMFRRNLSLNAALLDNLYTVVLWLSRVAVNQLHVYGPAQHFTRETLRNPSNWLSGLIGKHMMQKL